MLIVNMSCFTIPALFRNQCSSLSRKQFSTNTYLKSSGDIPVSRGFPFIGTLLALLLSGGPEKLHIYIDNRHKQLGPIFKEHMGPITSIFVSDPEMIREIFANEGKYPKHVLPEVWELYNKISGNRRGLYFMDGEEWLMSRKSLNRILLKDDFHIFKIEQSGVLEAHFTSWLASSKSHQIINLEGNLYVLSITFILFYLLGNAFIENQQLFTSRIEKLAVIVRQIFQCSVKLSIIPANVSKFLNLSIWRDFVYAVDESMKFSSDLLDDMYKFSHSDGILRDMMDENLSPEIIHRVVIDFILAAGDTTATATQWALYLLAKHKHIQHDLFSELKKEDGDKRLLKNILKETMRLYPIAPFVSRYLPHDVEIASFKIPAQELVSMSMYTCSRSEEYFPDANNFKPGRWLRVEKDEKWSYCSNTKFMNVNNAYASLPYSKGTRSCIGRKLADMQMMAVIKKIVTMYELDVLNTVDMKLNLICVPSKPIELRFIKR